MKDNPSTGRVRFGAKPSGAVALVLLAMLLCSCIGGSSGDSEGPGMGNLVFVSEFEGGRLYKAGAVPVLQLRGTHYQMGRQYGMLLKDDLVAAYHLTVHVMGRYLTYERMKQVAQNVYDRYPRKYRDVIMGMAETSELGFERQMILNALEMFPKINNYVPRCSGFGVWGDYTKDGRMIFGRNNDDAGFYRDFGGYVVVAVFNPTDSGMPVAVVNYAGVIYAPTAINRAGIFMELNSGNGPGGYMVDRPLVVVTMFSFLQDYGTQDELNGAFQTLSPDFSSIVNVADPTIAYSFECPLIGVKRRAPDEEGLLASSNHLVDPSWGIPPPEPDSANGWTVKRRENLVAFAGANKGSLDVDKVKEVLDLDMDRGGVFSDGTIFQVVVVPKDLVLWLRAPEHFEWQKIDLSRLFY